MKQLTHIVNFVKRQPIFGIFSLLERKLQFYTDEFTVVFANQRLAM